MGYPVFKTHLASCLFHNYKKQDKNRTNKIYTWVLFQTNNKNLPTCYKNGNIITWAGLNTSNLLQFISPSISTALGHMDHERNHLQYNTPETTIGIEEVQDITYISDLSNTKSYGIFALLISFTLKRTVYIDQDSAFPFLAIQ